MFVEKRPTCVTVIGWIWVIIGGLFSLIPSMILLMSLILPSNLRMPDGNNSLFYLIGSVEICLGIIGFVLGICFLRLKVWARALLEALTGLLLICIAGASLYWIVPLISSAFKGEPMDEPLLPMFIGETIFIGALLVIMLKFLRSKKVKSAMGKTGQPQESKSEIIAEIPTCIKVIGWVWKILGILMMAGGIATMVFLAVMISDAEKEIPAGIILLLCVFGLFGIMQIVIGFIGGKAGGNFLGLKERSRKILEILTWILFVYVAGFVH